MTRSFRSWTSPASRFVTQYSSSIAHLRLPWKEGDCKILANCPQISAFCASFSGYAAEGLESAGLGVCAMALCGASSRGPVCYTRTWDSENNCSTHVTNACAQGLFRGEMLFLKHNIRLSRRLEL